MTEHQPPIMPRRGIYLLPNLFTTGAMFAGFYAIVSGIQSQFVAASVAVFIAALLDSMDGRIARMTNTQTEFGVQYDSLSDMVSFSLAPALVMYTWSLSELRDLGPAWGKLGWAAAFVYAACGALRLARFNTQAGVADKRYFQGLSSPAAAGLLMAFLWSAVELGASGQQLMFVTPLLLVICGLLMVSRVRYYSFKAKPKNGRVPFVAIPAAVIVLVLLAMKPPFVLLAGFAAYVLMGPVLTLYGINERRRKRKRAVER
ncbi:MAG: phosphatidylcholine/phosphatidylserine synthase [Rhodanobacteraceae bacterium]